MNNTENRTSSPVSAPSGDELLRELMPKLGLEATGSTGRYKSMARLRYYLPRVLLSCLALFLTGTVMLVLLLPSRFQDVTVTESFDRAELEFRVDRLLLFESVTASLDGRPLAVAPLGHGSYRLNIPKNGVLTLETRTFADRSNTVSMTIDCIDEDPPFVERDLLQEGDVCIYLSDGDGKSSSGINWDSAQTTFADSGEPFEDAEIDRDAGLVRFPFPEKSVRIYVEDNSGNPLSLRFDRQ